MPYTPPLWPVSIKGVACDTEGRVLLLKNERAEWELPGGRLEGRTMPQPATFVLACSAPPFRAAWCRDEGGNDLSVRQLTDMT
jgi:8-oxo-dGTP pyrophosphatase MutT (NUDIX family)